MQEGIIHQRNESSAYEDEYIPENFEQAIVLLIREGNELMAKNHGPQGDLKIYHTLENHVNPLQERAKEIADALDLTSEQRQLIALAISWHDTIIEYDKPPENTITGMIRRHRGARDSDIEGQPSLGSKGNEAQSAMRMLEAMERVNVAAREKTGNALFTEEQMEIAKWAVDATFPKSDFGPDFKGVEFVKDPYYAEIAARNPAVREMVVYLQEQGITKGPHFSQPHLEYPLEGKKEIPLEVFAVAFADLSGAGLTDAEQFAVEGDNEGKESYHNLRSPDTMKRLLAGESEKDAEDRAQASEALIGWLKSQAGFAMWQMIRFEKVMNWMTENGQITPEKEQNLRVRFNNYEANIRASVNRAMRMRAEYDRLVSNENEKAAFAFLAGEMKLGR